MRQLIPLCAVLATLLGGNTLLGAENGAGSPTMKAALESAELARSIAASIIHERSLDYAGAGRQILAQQLESLSKGLLDGKITLSDAALVMQIVSMPSSQAASAAGLTPLAKTSVQRAENLLEGVGGSDATTTAGPAASAETPKAPLAEASPAADPSSASTAPPKMVISDVCGVENGEDHHVMVAALSLNSKDGLVKGEHVVFKLKGKLIAQGTILRLDDHLSFVEITKGSLVDPAQDVTQQCQAIITPSP